MKYLGHRLWYKNDDLMKSLTLARASQILFYKNDITKQMCCGISLLEQNLLKLY